MSVTYPMNFRAAGDDAEKDDDFADAKKMPTATTAPSPAPMKPQMNINPGFDVDGGGGGGGGGGFGRRSRMIAMHKVWTRTAAVATYTGVAPSLTAEIAKSEAALAAAPDSREKHRALVQALSYAGELAKAKEVATSWLERDRLDPQALGYLADLVGRDGERDRSLRVLAGLVDLDPDKTALHERLVVAYEHTGRLAQACGHRIALATLTRTVASAAGAARCLRMVGRDQDATLVMGELADDAQRGAAEKLATVAAVEPKVTGDLVVNGTWQGGADIDLTLVAPDGTRVSWQGGRSDVLVGDATALDREELAVTKLRRGNYLLEVARGDASTTPIRGTLDVTVLGVKKALPFELTGSHAVIGRVTIGLVSHLEPWPGGW
jgi:tetratricopeptide (TPR) repeat protein